MEQQENIVPARPHAQRPLARTGVARRSLTRKFLALGPQETLLYVGELRALFTEIAMFGENIEAWFKHSPAAHLERAKTLPRLYAQLKSGEIFGAQIVYEIRGLDRADTLVVRPQGVVCVRAEVTLPGRRV